MFERRLKILLICLTIGTLLLAARTFWAQIVHRDYWSAQAQTFSRKSMIDTNRGRILDCKGRELAVDQSCLNLCVDYRVIPFELDLKTYSSKIWLRNLAKQRLQTKVEGFDSKPLKEKSKLIDDEIILLKKDIDHMWATLAAKVGMSQDDLSQKRAEIIALVEKRRDNVRENKYKKLNPGVTPDQEEPWYAWLFGKTAVDKNKIEVEVEEQRMTHVIISNVDYAIRNEILKHQDEYPGVVFEAGINRYYPYGSVASQTIGTNRKVQPDDFKKVFYDESQEVDELKKYQVDDEIGRSGLEAMLESRLRGTRGLRELDTDKKLVVQDIPAKPGEDVKITIDIELQKKVEDAFKNVHFKANEHVEQNMEMLGAAVMIDVPTGEVRALVSWPTYDLNSYDKIYTTLARDSVNNSLLNRALTVAREPGSTVKPIVGLGGITDNILLPAGRLSCDGYLYIGNKRQTFGRCWTMSIFNGTHMEHPYDAPLPDHTLNFAQALERSCNVFHEHLGYMMGYDRLMYWFKQFGLGRPTGIGLRESSGRLLKSYENKPADVCLASIGEGRFSATPIQMANVCATIARNGIWMKPTLLPVDSEHPPGKIDLNLDPQALAEVHRGMFNVVNGEAGTGSAARMDDLHVAGKTGSAQSAPLKVMVVDQKGEPLRLPTGQIQWKTIPVGTSTNPNKEIGWYRAIGDNEEKIPSHAWMIAYAPAEKPEIAIAVLVDYGGGGGVAAGSVIKQSLEAWKKQRYPQPSK